MVLRPVVGVRFQVLFHSPCRGSFHLSVTVLVRYRLPNVFSLGRWSARVPTGFHVSRRTQDARQLSLNFTYGAVTLFGRPSQTVLLPSFNLLRVLQPQPDLQTGLGFSAFARHYSRNNLFSSSYLDVSVRSVPFSTLCVQVQKLGYRPPVGFPIRISSDISLVHSSPRLFAVYRVLLRHLAPRHPPYALSSLRLPGMENLTLSVRHFLLALLLLRLLFDW